MGPARVLLSACNVGRHASSMCLVVVDLAERCARLVDLEAVARQFAFQGVTGLAVIPGGYAIGLQMRDSAVALFDSRLQFQRILRLSLVRDIHSMAWMADSLLIVSTGTNQVIRLSIETGAEHVYWRASSIEDADCVHLNGICLHAGDVLVSQFGPLRRNYVRAGSLLNAGTGRRLLGGLREPHTAYSDGNDVFVIESLTGSLFRVRNGDTPVQVARVRGYARGLHVAADTVVMGVSGFRVQSRALGVDRPAEVSLGGREGAWLDVTYRDQRFQLDLGDLASEIYDIVPLESEVEELPLMSESLEQAWRCFRQQDTEGCLRWLSKSDPSVGRFMLECHVSGSTNDHAAELVAALRASDLAPGLAEPAFRKSCALMKLGRFVEAVPVAEDLTASHPKEPTYLQHLGGVYLRGGRLNDARRVIERARVLSPNSPGLIALGAWVAWRCGDYQSALDDATRALEMAPGIQHAHRARCYALWSLGDRAAARTALALAMRAYPDDGLLRRLAAQADDRLLAGTQE